MDPDFVRWTVSTKFQPAYEGVRTRILTAIGGTLAALALSTAPASAGTGTTATTTAAGGSTAQAGAPACGWDPRASECLANLEDGNWTRKSPWRFRLKSP
ncbi:hypothetical protein ACFYY8_09165 [Streptosporangium sp. NPDC001559]|uniref:hypothetical protein n=1 Tax=Streptosporangium sp. NPDC001559 TaxID=3366187 RepID=UPI0036F1312B